jgi:hypothetical protein
MSEPKVIKDIISEIMQTFHPDPKPDFFTQKIQRKSNIAKDKVNASRSHAFFYKSVWQSAKKKVCFECEEPIPFFDKRFCHHLIFKRYQKDYSIGLDGTWNGVLLCLTCHSKAHTNIEFAPKTQAQTFIMLKKYEQFKKKH